MGQVISGAARNQILDHLLESRRIYGSLRQGEAERAAQVCGVSLSTIYRWLKNRSAARISRARYVPSEDDQVAVFRAFGNIRLAYELRMAETKEMPSISTFRRGIYNQLDKPTLEAAKGGLAARDQARMVLIDREYARNERWEGDHTQLEVHIMAPHNTKPVRPWLTWFIDAGTRYVVGWALSTEHPTKGTVLAVIRMGVTNNDALGPVHGRPDMLVWDNGQEFIANAVTEAGARLGSLTVNLYPYSPSKKGKIERINLTIERELLARLPHYTNGPKKKDGRSYFSARDYLTLEQFVVELEAWVRKYNTKRSHSSLGGRTPEDAWYSDPTPITPVPAEQVRQFTLDYLPRKVRRDGGVHVGGIAYTSPVLIGLEGRSVDVGRVPYDESFVEIFEDDEWVCTAKPTTKLSPSDVADFLETRDEKNRPAARLRRKATREARREAERRPRMAPITGDQTEAKLLPQRERSTKSSRASGAELLGLTDQLGEVE